VVVEEVAEEIRGFFRGNGEPVGAVVVVVGPVLVCVVAVRVESCFATVVFRVQSSNPTNASYTTSTTTSSLLLPSF